MSVENDNDPVPRDAWLREALRHAPDADAAPPPKLNDTILRMGRAAVAPRVERATPAAAPSSSSSSWSDGLAALWAWLARPPVAAGFAGLMVATVVGVMWWDRPLQEALPPREEPVAAAPAALPTQTAAADAVPAQPPKAAGASTRVAAAPAATEPTARKATTPASPAPAAPRQEAPPAAAAVAAAPPPVLAQNSGTAEAMRARESGERREVAAAKSAAPAAAPLADAAAPSALAGRGAAASSAIETPGFSNLRFEIRRKPEAWTWTRDDGAARPMDAAVEAWIAQADRTARPVWQAGSMGSEQVSATLRFTRDGVVRAVLRIGPAGMRLTRGGKTESAELSRGQAAALLSGLDALGP